ncbi:MAG: response regulator [Chloroflexota bacterium]|nr:response regulator [Chloroflexota bacterium]PLS79678.1 MAG: hypothetical protein CYG59_11915 [Chloroflexota bacterium]
MRATILLLEDDVVLQDLLREVLQDEGYQVVAADNLPHLLEAAPAQADLLVTDLLVNFQMVGLQAIQEVRQAIGADLPALICTAALRQLEMLEPEIAQLRAQVLHKPFTIDELVDVVREALRPTEALCRTVGAESVPAEPHLISPFLRTSLV